MTTSNHNTVSGATATPAPTFSSHDSSAAAQNLTPRPPIVPWVETGFVAIPIELFAVAASQLSDRARKLYAQHCSHARTRGENAGLSFCYRETLARELNCSLDTVDRGNLELEKHNLIENVGRRFQHGGAVVYRLNAPSQWKFEAKESSAKAAKSPLRASRKSAAPGPQTCGAGAADLRPITRDKKHLRAKEQQTALLANENLPPDAALAGAPQAQCVAVVVVDNQNSVERTKVPTAMLAAPTEKAARDARAREALEAQGFKASMAERLLRENGAQACFYQLERLGRQKNVRSPTGWLQSALKRDDRDGNQAAAGQKVAPPSAPTPEQQAEKAVRAAARLQRASEIAARVWAKLDARRQVYVSRCVELESSSLLEVIKREENYAFCLQFNKAHDL